MNDQHMYELSTPTHPDHLADITAGQRAPARITPQSNADAYGVLAVAVATANGESTPPTPEERVANDALYAEWEKPLHTEYEKSVTFTEEQLVTDTPLPVSPHFAEALAGSEAYHKALVARVEERVQKPVRPEYIAGSRTDPYGMRFPWGPIMEMHQIGPYTVLEYLEDTSTYDDTAAWARHGRTLYHVYVDGKNTAVSATSLDSALAGAIAYRRDGANSRAGDYFMRMVGGD